MSRQQTPSLWGGGLYMQWGLHPPDSLVDVEEDGDARKHTNELPLDHGTLAATPTPGKCEIT